MQLGLRIEELDLLDAGMVFDMIAESANDEYYADKKNQIRMATQDDFDKF